MTDNHGMKETLRRRGTGANGVVGEWLLRLGIWFAIAGVVLFDAGSIAVHFFGLDGKANDIAVIVSTGVGDGQYSTPTAIHDAAEQLAQEAGAKLKRAEVDPEGILHIKLRRTAPTLIVGKIGPIKDWAVLTAEATAHTN